MSDGTLMPTKCDEQAPVRTVVGKFQRAAIREAHHVRMAIHDRGDVMLDDLGKMFDADRFDYR